jgi:hypothetical protein
MLLSQTELNWVRSELSRVVGELFGDDPIADELIALKNACHAFLLEELARARTRLCERWVGPKPFCRTPSGQYDQHGQRVRFAGPMKLECAFCRRSIHATPDNPEGDLHDRPHARRRRKD